MDKKVFIMGKIQTIILVLTLALNGVALGCAGNKSFGKSDPAAPPAWVLKLPQEKGYAFARGSCGRTSDPKDAEENAADDARVQLAKTIKVEVSSLLVDFENSNGSAFGGSRFIHDYSVRVDREALELSLAGSQIISVWLDKKGRAGTSGTTYALARLSKDSLVADLSRMAQEMKMKAEEMQGRMGQGKGLAPLIQKMKDKGVVKTENRNDQVQAPPDEAFQDLEKELEKLKEK
ncbi:MAG: hypothetical protein PHE84_08160 [bacterium]|nr:hypothetical protein [bacterium]